MEGISEKKSREHFGWGFMLCMPLYDIHVLTPAITYKAES